MRKPSVDDTNRPSEDGPSPSPDTTDSEGASPQEAEIDRYIEQVRNLIPHPPAPAGDDGKGEG